MEQQPPVLKNNRHKNLFIKEISWLEYTFLIQACFYFTEIRRISPRKRIAHYTQQGCTNTGLIFSATPNVFSIITATVFLTYNTVPVHLHRAESAR